MFAEAVPPALRALDRARHLAQTIRRAGRDDILTARLAPNMFDCRTQLRITAGFALRATFPLTAKAAPDTETGPRDIESFIAWAGTHVSELAPDDFEGAQSRLVIHRAGDADLTQTGADYLRLFALPNLWFHLSMAYAIARREGLAIGKADFDGWHAYAPGFSFTD